METLENNRERIQKKMLMNICRKINNCSSGAKTILKETPICNLRQISREAKNIKDPNPLQTMMNSISQKYPITVDKEKARKCELPVEFLGGKDIHGYGRRLCRLDAIKWYIENCNIPGESVKKSIDVLFQNKEREVREYYNWDWEQSIVYFGDKSITRAWVQMNRPLVELPQRQRNQYIIAAMFPETMINWRGIDNGILEKLGELKALTIEAKLPIISQIRIIASFVDPRPRVIPISLSLHESTRPIRHAFSSHNHMIRVSKRVITSEMDMNAPIELMGKCIAYLINIGVRPHEILPHMKHTLVGSHRLETLAFQTAKTGAYLDITRSMFGIKSPLVKEIFNSKFFPQKGNMSSRFVQNLKGTGFYIYDGTELIMIKFKEGSARVQRTNNYLTSLKASMMTQSTFTGLIARLATFMKWNFLKSKKRNISQMTDECFNAALEEPWRFISEATNGKITKKEYDRCTNNLISFGPVEFVKEAPSCSSVKSLGTIVGKELIFTSGMKVPIVQPKEYPTLTVDFVISDRYFSHFLHPSKRLKNRILFYNDKGNFSEMITHINIGDFEWENFSLREGLNKSERELITCSSRSLVLQMISDIENCDRRFIILAYCFSANTKAFVTPEQRKIVFEWYGTITIDLKGVTGAVKINKNGMFVDKDVIVQGDYFMTQKHLLTFYPGWRLLANPHAKAKLKPIYFLRDPNVKNGFVVKVIINGCEVYLKRDPTIADEAAVTIQRQLNALEREKNEEKPWFIIEKNRKRFLETTGDESGPSKILSLSTIGEEDFAQLEEDSDSD